MIFIYDLMVIDQSMDDLTRSMCNGAIFVSKDLKVNMSAKVLVTRVGEVCHIMVIEEST